MKKINSRRSIRLSQYDYSQEGMYFITICCHQKMCRFGEIINESMALNTIGRIAHSIWQTIPDHYPSIELESFVVMPNHMHGILTVNNRLNKNQSIGTVVRNYKATVTRQTRVKSSIQRLWQRNYYEHIIRNERDYIRVAEYIEANPALWNQDALHPENNIRSSLVIENP